MPTDPVDDHIRGAAQHFGTEVADAIDLDLALDSTSRRRRGTNLPVAVVVALAVIALVAGLVAVGASGGDDVDVAIDEDGEQDERERDDDRPDLDGMPAPIALGGPRDGKDSVGLPVKVEPATGLTDGQTVTVTGTGFPPGEQVGVVMCTREAGREHGGRGADACNLTRSVQGTSDSDGVVVVEFAVERLLLLDGQEVDCASESDRCLVGMGLIRDYDQSGGAVVAFDSGAPLPEPPTASLARVDGLVDGDEVELRVTGLLPGSDLGYEICDLVRDRCGGFGFPVGVVAGSDGTLQAPIRLWRTMGAYRSSTGGSANLDCALERCVLDLHGQASGGRSIPPIEIRFDPAVGEREAPVARLLENGPFPLGSTIPIEVTGLDDDVRVDAMICPTERGGQCYGAGADSDPDGTARIDLLVPDPSVQPGPGPCEGCTISFSVYPPTDPGGLRPPLIPESLPVTITP